ncbi:leucine--tRNA ligase [Candidatus Peregrinibacteria bacterium]|nr:leucine--tRNA ligase [Candidatus Peregrinibacteria bacterium]
MSLYEPRKSEIKWQKRWEESGLYKTNFKDTKHQKYYNLVMFPYPSGDKLHIGHWYGYAPADSWGRYMRMKGFNVFEPMGYDSFGLPAENYAIKHGVHPAVSTQKNIDYMRKQLMAMGTMYDWTSEIQTSAPEYYKWTQWVFLQLYKKGLAYRKKAPVNWCPNCQTVLANEQVQDGTCERCGAEVTKKDLTQWFFKMKEYAEKLLNYEGLNWPEKTRMMQENWIGKSIGSEIVFDIADGSTKKPIGKTVTVFTTRIDTLFGCTYMVLAPEHPLTLEICTREHRKNIVDYIEKTKRENDIVRSSETREKTGVETGAYAINPVNGELIPVWTADYVLASYGTGAVMAVPAHDERDYAFAKKYKLPIKEVIIPKKGKSNIDEFAFTEDGVLVNSDEFDEMNSLEAREKITKFLKSKGKGKFVVQYKLRDWLVSRQRFWGAPIPIVYCDKCGEVAVPEKDLPVKLPMKVDFTPKGESPLATCPDFVNTTCPNCKGNAKREVDTMDTFFCSSWYYLRYPSANEKDIPFDEKRINKWLPVDMYIGGPEHACMHLIYARFICKVLHDLGYIDFNEPFKTLVHQGLITKDSAKMSKSKGNTVSPDEFIEKYGSDVFRMYLMFMGPYSEGGDWNDSGIKGIARFVDKFYDLIYTKSTLEDEKTLKCTLHKTIKKVGEDMEKFHFNTVVSSLMEFTNTAKRTGIDDDSKKQIVKLIAPIAPHLAEELWENLGGGESIFNTTWPEYSDKLTASDTFELVIQVNGKVRAKTNVSKDISEEEAINTAKSSNNVNAYLEGKQIIKAIYVPGRIVNIVVK